MPEQSLGIMHQIIDLNCLTTKQGEDGSCVATTYSEPGVQVGDIKPGGKTLLNILQYFQLTESIQFRANPSDLDEPDLHTTLVYHREFSLHCDASDYAARTTQTQQIEAGLLVRIQRLQIFKYVCLTKPRLAGTAPSQLPNAFEKGQITGYVDNLSSFTRGDSLLQTWVVGIVLQYRHKFISLCAHQESNNQDFRLIITRKPQTTI